MEALISLICAYIRQMEALISLICAYIRQMEALISLICAYICQMEALKSQLNCMQRLCDWVKRRSISVSYIYIYIYIYWFHLYTLIYARWKHWYHLYAFIYAKWKNWFHLYTLIYTPDGSTELTYILQVELWNDTGTWCDVYAHWNVPNQNARHILPNTLHINLASNITGV